MLPGLKFTALDAGLMLSRGVGGLVLHNIENTCHTKIKTNPAALASVQLIEDLLCSLENFDAASDTAKKVRV